VVEVLGKDGVVEDLMASSEVEGDHILNEGALVVDDVEAIHQ